MNAMPDPVTMITFNVASSALMLPTRVTYWRFLLCFQIVEFGKKNVELQHQVDEWKLKYNMLEKKNEELRQQDSQRKEDELAAVKRTNNQLAVSVKC